MRPKSAVRPCVGPRGVARTDRRTAGGGGTVWGFTLVEVLVAVAVVSVAASVFVSMFISSLTLAEASRNQKIAASLADEHMAIVLADPARYDWHLQELSSRELVPVALRGGDAADEGGFAPPAALPAVPSASTREEALYEKFSWQVYGRLPEPDLKYVEVTVAVRWPEKGRDRLVTLTSAVARASIAPARAVREGAP